MYNLSELYAKDFYLFSKKLTKLTKSKASRQKKSSNNTRSGFAKPTAVSVELCKFMGLKDGTEVARTEVTKFLTTYIKENNLQNAENKRVIVPDKKLASLLNVGKKDELTYFNLQKYMKPHFVSSSSK